MIHPLPQQLNRWLGSILFFLWHVYVVYENHESLARWWAIDSFSSLFELLIQGVLGLVRRGLRRESYRDGLVFLW